MRLILQAIYLLCMALSGVSAQVNVTYLSNEGVMIADGKSKVLIDPFFKESFKLYQTLPIKSLEHFLNVNAELKSANAILISHRHRDHIDAGWVAEYMNLNPGATLLSSTQATDSVVNHFGIPANRVINFLPKMNEEIVSHQLGAIKIKAVWIRHGYESNYGVVNLCFLTEMGGKKIFHLGDSEANKENFKKIDLKGERIDLLLVPFWYLTMDEGVAIIRDKINPKQIAAIHLVHNYEKYKADILKNFPTTTFFDTPFEKITVK